MQTTPQIDTRWDNLPANARLWIYQANRQLSADEVRLIEEKGLAFSDNWMSHGDAMSAAVKLFNNRFLIIGADEEEVKASGCSIDGSVHFVQQLGADFGVDFFDRTIVHYMSQETMAECTLSEISALVDSGEMTADTLLFDTLVTSKSELDNGWPRPMSESWAARYLG